MLTPQTTPVVVTPNAVIIPSIQISTRIIAGKLRVSAQVALQAAQVTDQGTPTETWVASGNVVMLQLSDLNNLPDDIASCTTAIATAEIDLITAIGAVNAIRKLV